MTLSLKDYLREKLVGLPEVCPFSGNRACSCPFHEIRKRSPQARDAWVEGLSDDRVIDILIGHQQCLEKKDYGEYAIS